MDAWATVAIFIVIIFFCNFFMNSKKIDDNEIAYDINLKKINYSNYNKKNLLTKTEYSFYMKSRLSLQKKNLFLYPKVRLEDFIEATGEGKEKQSLRGRIKSRHVDFLVCDDKLHIKAAIELDDISHSSEKAKAADQFKNELFNSLKLPLVRIQVKQDYTNDINNLLNLLTFH